jgi:hypothetical protein
MNITLLDGRIVPIETVFFDEDTYAFTLSSGENVTNKVLNVDKRKFSAFDNVRYNEILYAQQFYKENGRWPDAVGSTSVWANFAWQLITDPLGAPIDYFSDKADQFLKSKAMPFILLGTGVLILIIIASHSE